MGELHLRIATWNTRFGAADEALLAGRDIDLLCLQEAKTDTVERFGRHFDWAFFAHDERLLGDTEPFAKHAPAVLGRAPFVGQARALLRSLVCRDKLLAVDVTVSGTPSFFTVASYHAMNGRQGPDGLDKPRMSMQVAEWLARESGPVILGMDANSPDVDHPDPDRIECHFAWLGPRHYERSLLAVESQHRLGDVLRLWLDDHPDDFAAVRRERPDGPLAISHRSGKGKDRPGNPRRYDHIYATQPDFQVESVHHLYEDACNHGSDHALVIADLCAEVEGRPGSAVDPTA